VGFLARAEFGLFPAQPPLLLATAIPSRVRVRARSASNSAIIDSVVNRSRPIGSVGSWIDPPMLSRTPDAVSSSTMSRASGTERASRSSLVTTRVSPCRQAARAWRSPVAVRAGQSVVEVNPLGVDAEGGEGILLGGEVLLHSGDSAVANLQFSHRPSMPVSPPSPGRTTGPAYGTPPEE